MLYMMGLTRFYYPANSVENNRGKCWATTNSQFPIGYIVASNCQGQIAVEC